MDKKKKKNEETAEKTECETPETEETKEAKEAAAESAENTEAEAAGPDPLEEAEKKCEALQKDLDETRDRYLRIAAEYENYRRRSARERDALYGDATAAAVAAMLPVLDNLERALQQPTEDEAARTGVEMILKQFYTSLEKLGVKEIPALGEQFDPQFHNAVMHVEQENCDDNTVVEVFQKGFVMGERVVRHAIVKVAN